jgi:hypothetical protein
MVAMSEIVFLSVFVVLGVWWLRRTKLYRANRRSVVDRAQDTPQRGRAGADLGFYDGGSGGSGGGFDGGGGFG